MSSRRGSQYRFISVFLSSALRTRTCSRHPILVLHVDPVPDSDWDCASLRGAAGEGLGVPENGILPAVVPTPSDEVDPSESELESCDSKLYADSPHGSSALARENSAHVFAGKFQFLQVKTIRFEFLQSRIHLFG